MTDLATRVDEVTQWRTAYEASLRADWGWLSVTGLHWLEDGVHSLGSAATADIRLEPGDSAAGSAVPGHVADVIRNGSSVRLEIVKPGSILKDGQPAASHELVFDGTQGERFTTGNQSFLVVRRGDRVGVRTWDNDSEQRRQYRGSDWFEASDEWQVEARFRPFPEPRTVHYLNVIGDEKQALVTGDWVFSLQGRELSLISLTEGDAPPFFVFRDATSGTETYGASRFLKAPKPTDGRTLLDFNLAYNPPCAFTPHATCPLPPRENIVDVRITAGERLYTWP